MSSTPPPAATPAAASAVDGAEGPLFTIEEFYPVFFSSWERETGLCSICCNQVEGPCVVCQSNAEVTSVECSIAWGECGHAFHAHCIDKWLRTRRVCPLDNIPWKDYTAWNAAA